MTLIYAEKTIISHNNLRFLLVDSKDFGEQREERKGFLNTLSRFGEQQV